MSEICCIFHKPKKFSNVPLLQELFRTNSLSVEIYGGTEEQTELQTIENRNTKLIFFGQLLDQIKENYVLNKFKQDGADYLSSLQGKFMVIAYDKKKKETLIVRDQAGFQHGYFLKTNDFTIVSSSLRLLLKIAVKIFHFYDKISTEGVAYYLTFQYLPNPKTLFEKIMQIPLESYLLITDKGLSVKSHTSFLTPELIHPKKNQNNVSTIKTLLLDSLQKQLKGSTRHIGAFLSGGMDTSTNIALMVNELNIHPAVFTASFTEKDYDETEDAREVSSYFGLEQNIININPSMIKDLPSIVKLYDNPHGDKSVFAEYFLCQSMKTKGIKFLVTGEGGDEIFGYPRTKDAYNSLENLSEDNLNLSHFYLELTSLSPERMRLRMFKDLLSAYKKSGELYLHDIYKKYIRRTPFEQIYFGQWKTWLLEDVYMKDSRLSNHFQLRLVTPYMDQKVMKFMSDLEPEEKKNGLHNKNYLRSMMRASLPDSILRKPKHKFWLPFSEWFRNEWFNVLDETLLSSNSFIINFVSRKEINYIIKEHLKEEVDHSRLLWALLFLNTWYMDISKNILSN